MANTLWILSEERPKLEAIKYVLERFSLLHGSSGTIKKLQILPLKNSSGTFSFWYEILGYENQEVDRVLLKIISGSSSFVDFLVFHQETEPVEGERPLFMVEETKTDDEESRNTGVYQRCSKFVYAELHYPKIDLCMFYNLQIPQRATQTDTNIFGTRCLVTIGVAIAGKKVDKLLNTPFADLNEMIAVKSAMRRPPAGNVPIDISIVGDELHVSGRLFKQNGLNHDPNIGAISLIAATARKLGWSKDILVTRHGLSQIHVQSGNKFVRIANALGMKIDGLNLPKSSLMKPYWHYNVTGEKLATIFVHLVVESFTSNKSIFENHAGSEKGYFVTSSDDYLALEKYVPGVMPRKSLDIPDLILRDDDRHQILNIEGKTFSNMELGLRTLDNYGDIEELYIEKFYPAYEIKRSLVLFGGEDDSVSLSEISVLLNQSGQVILGADAPELIKEAFKSLDEHWKVALSSY